MISPSFQTAPSSIASNSRRPICRRGGTVPALLLNGRPFQRINWMHVTGKLSAAEAAPFRTHESSKRNKSSPPSSPSPFPAISSFSFSHAGEERGSTGVNSLSDEKDKWRRCFGSGDSSKNRARARDGTCRGGGGGWGLGAAETGGGMMED